MNYMFCPSYSSIYYALYNLDTSIVVKPHPVVSDSDEVIAKVNSAFKKFKTVPDYLPGELLLNNVKRNVLAITSELLIAASKIKGIKAISLLELVEWKNTNFKKSLKDKLVHCSNNKIIFVGSYSELENIIKNKWKSN